jgi:uncharacterized membrane protein YtjA (UPF0391 family)
MLRWAFAFLVLALLAALFGWGGVRFPLLDSVRVLFFLFVAGFLFTFTLGLTGRGRPAA